MLINPLVSYPMEPNSRLLSDDFGLVGQQLHDPHHKGRYWKIVGIYAPVSDQGVRAGIRARVIDGNSMEDGDAFVSFINQRDLEVLLGVRDPGDWCVWLGEEYVSHEHYKWYGFCCDQLDLNDDLQARELSLRAAQLELSGSVLLPTGLEITRLVHRGKHDDIEELLQMAGDFDRGTGQYPDMKLETIDTRWVLLDKQGVRWTRQ